MTRIELDDRGFLSRCPQCGQRNRMAYERIGQTLRCGKCQTELAPPGESIEVKNERNFEALIHRSGLPVLVDFWAAWCGPCKMVAPELAKVAADGAGRWIIAKVSTETLAGLAQRFRINSIPTLVLFRAGREVLRQSGVMPAAKIRELIEQQAQPTGDNDI